MLCVDILPGGAEGRTLSATLFRAFYKAAKKGVKMGKDMVSGSMFADDFMAISETPAGLQQRTKKMLGIAWTRECVGCDFSLEV